MRQFLRLWQRPAMLCFTSLVTLPTTWLVSASPTRKPQYCSYRHSFSCLHLFVFPFLCFSDPPPHQCVHYLTDYQLVVEDKSGQRNVIVPVHDQSVLSDINKREHILYLYLYWNLYWNVSQIPNPDSISLLMCANLWQQIKCIIS